MLGNDNLLATFQRDIQAIWDKDPAARNWIEVLTCYPGLHAVCAHRVAHRLHNMGVPVLPRLMSHVTRTVTGIEIHPGAKLGQGVFIDHGIGVVIGETAEIGDDVLIYQGVTLGGTTLEPVKRHPTIGPNVVIGAGASILGNIEVGANSFVGAGSVVTKPVPPGATVVGIPGKVVASPTPEPSQTRRQEPLPDPIMAVLGALQDRLTHMEAELDRLRQDNRELRQR